MSRYGNSHLSLRTKAIGISVAITTIALTVVAATGLLQLKRQIAAEQQRAADSMSLGFARASELAIAVHDKNELSRLAESFLRDQNVLFIAAYDDRSQLLATAIRDHESWAAYQQSGNGTRRCTVGENSVEPSSRHDEFTNEIELDPLVPAGGPGKSNFITMKKVGRVAVGVSTLPGMVAMRDQSRLTLGATVAAAAAGAVVLFLTLGGWMKRLQQLAEVSQCMSRGDFSISASDGRGDEIGELARSFDFMRVSLQERDLKLRNFTDTLQDQVKQRTKDLELALKTAEEANRAKSLFLANMSHELRTPLNGVIGMVDLMLAAGPNPRQKHYCEIAKSSARSLLELINDILDFSKIEAGKLELDSTDFNLHEVVESVVQMLGERAEKKKIELVCGFTGNVPKMVCGDSIRLRQVILNLTTNAIKFTEKGEVVVNASLQGQTETDSVIKISVRDSGIGIPASRVDRLFKSFSQVDASTTRRFGGTGLGLAISQRIVEMMGGQIGVESLEGKGSTFWFTVRLEKRAHVPLTLRDAHLDPRGLRVLAVDDNLTNREILHAQLASWSLRADVADSAEQAMGMLHDAACKGEPYRFAILDMHMPNVDGMQLAQQIKADPQTSNLILISLSSISDQLRPQVMNRLGFSACLTKPALPSQLYNAIIDSLAASESVLAPTHQPESRYEPMARLSGVRILIAEDNEVNQLVASELLMHAGCDCTIVVNGREAVEAALGNVHDVILMDCQMPEMDGFEATRLIREAEKASGNGRRRPIVALTANAIKGDRELCLAAGMDEYVTKPIDAVELFRAIHSVIPASRLAEMKEQEASRLQGKPATDPMSETKLSEAETVAVPVAPPVDLTTLKHRCMGNRKIAAKALSKFDTGMVQDVRNLADSVQRGDTKAAAAAAHKIKGAAANVSAEGLRRIASEFESLIKADTLSQTQNCLDQLQQEVERFHDYLATALRELTPVEEGLIDLQHGPLP